MASAAVKILMGKIASFLENEVNLLVGVRDEVKDIQAELQAMEAFLEDADRKQPSNEVEKDWVGNVRDVTYEVEDIIDEFIYHMNGQRTGARHTRSFYKVIHMPKNMWVRHKIATKLQQIRKTIKEIPERNQRYAVVQSNTSIPRNDRNSRQFQGESSRFLKEDELVGIDVDREMLTSWLTEGDSKQTVISVLGMGGSGKTTLVAKTFNNDKVTRYFDCYAWITVSQTYVLEDLFRRLIKHFHQSGKEQVPAGLDAMGETELLVMMESYLRSKRFLVVLDDVWDIKLWDQIKFALPDSTFESRIVITTRKEDIATYCVGVRSHIHRVPPLEPSEAWRLFCMKAFYSQPNNVCPEELKPFARELVEKCEGLPLALVALGALMFPKKHVSDWSRISNSLNWHLSNNPKLEHVKSILLLSFNELSYHLKHCFLYCSIFPEDFVIRRNRLIRLWIGEGLVEARKEIPEEVADDYQMELTFRSMLQVVERDSFGRPRAWKMHDLMREIAITISERGKIFIFNNGEGDIDCSKARRLSVQFQKVGKQVEIKSSSDMSKLRSLLVFYPMKYVQDPLLNTIPSGLKLLKVLDLQDVPIDNLPNEIVKKLLNLRYLNIRRTLIKELPSSIERLRNLHTLDMRETKIEVIPDEVGKLENLRHLIMYRLKDYEERMNFKYCLGWKSPKNISKLKKLQVLSCINAEGDVVRQLGNMTQLTRFGIANLKQQDGKDLCGSVQKMTDLRYLFAMASEEQEVLEINALNSPPPLLNKVVLVGKLESVPPWLCLLRNMLDLGMHWTRLTQDLLPHIAALPWLIRLSLTNAYVGEKLCFREGFAKLETLELVNMPELNEIEIEKGVMPDVTSIQLNCLMKLKRVPDGIEFLSKLHMLNLESVPMDLIQTIVAEGEKNVDRPRVERIPNINHYYHSSGKYFYKSLSRSRVEHIPNINFNYYSRKDYCTDNYYESISRPQNADS